MSKRRPEQGEDAIAQGLRHIAVILMHRVHHQFGRHRNNYGDIVWWDMLFGTWENPCAFDATCGFEYFRERQLLPMLAWTDVHAAELASSAER